MTQPGTSIVSVDAVAFSPNGKTLATGDLGGSTYLWSVATDAQIAAVPAPSTGNPDADTGVNALAFSPDGQKLAVGDDDDKTYLYADVGSGQ